MPALDPLAEPLAAQHALAAHADFLRGVHTEPVPPAELAGAAQESIGAAQDVLACVSLALLYIGEAPDGKDPRAYVLSAAEAVHVAEEILSEAYTAASVARDLLTRTA